MSWCTKEDATLSTPIILSPQNIPALGTEGLTRKFHQLFKLEITFRMEQRFISGITYVASKFL